jgi:hypothetical protein
MRQTEHQSLPLTVEAVAVAIGRSPGTVWRYAREGRLHRVRIYGRTGFDPHEVARLAAELNSVDG